MWDQQACTSFESIKQNIYYTFIELARHIPVLLALITSQK